MIQKTRAPGNIPKRFPGPSLQNVGAHNARSKWGPVANNKRRCLACLSTMKSVAWRSMDGVAHSGARRRLVSLTIRDESARGARARAHDRTQGPAPPHRRSRSAMCCAQLDALQVEKRIGVSGSRTHLASGTASGRCRGPHRHGGVQTYSFLFHGVLLLAGIPFPFYFHFTPVRNAWSRDSLLVNWRGFAFKRDV